MGPALNKVVSCVILLRFHWNRSDEMMMIVLEVTHQKVRCTQRLDVEIPRKNLTTVLAPLLLIA